MLKRTCLVAVWVFSLLSCQSDRYPDKPVSETPQILDDSKSSYDVISKRGNDDLVDGLYSELLTKDNDLRKLEDMIIDLRNSKSDSFKAYSNYDNKNQSYFNSVDKHIASIKDSLLRERLRGLVKQQRMTYDNLLRSHHTLLQNIDSNQQSVSDLHAMLKIVRTLPVMDKYQKENLPDPNSLEGFKKQQQKAIRLADTLSKK